MLVDDVALREVLLNGLLGARDVSKGLTRNLLQCGFGRDTGLKALCVVQVKVLMFHLVLRLKIIGHHEPIFPCSGSD